MDAKYYLTLVRVVYVAVIASAFSGYLNEFVPVDAVILSFLFLFFLAFESVARTLACNLILQDPETQNAGRIRFAHVSIILEALAIIVASHWVLNYLDVALSNTEKKTTILALFFFVFFNIVNNSWHIIHYHKHKYIPKKVTLWKFLLLPLIDDLYEVNHESKVPLVAGAIEKDFEFASKLVEREDWDIPNGGLRLDKITMQQKSFWKMVRYYFERAVQNILVQIYGMNLLILNFISAIFLLLLWEFPLSLHAVIQWALPWDDWVSVISLAVFGAITLIAYAVTTHQEVNRQVIVKTRNKKEQDQISIVFDVGLKATRLEKSAQVIGNFGVVFSFVLVSSIVIAKSNTENIQEIYGYWIIVMNFIIAFGTAISSRPPEKVAEIHQRVVDAHKALGKWTDPP